MSDFPSQLLDIMPTGVIASNGQDSVGPAMRTCAQGFTALTAWPAANLAIYIPFYVQTPVTVYQIAWDNGATLGGNVDVGIYNYALTRLVSSGSTAQSGTSVPQVANITDTLLAPGTYFMAMAADSNTATYRNSAGGQTRYCRVLGISEQSTAFPLPTTATFAAFATALYVPLIVLCLKSVI